MTRSYYSHARQELLPFVPQRVYRALDVGCGEGAFGALLKQRHDCYVCGVEPEKSAANRAAARLDRVICSGFDDANLANEQFDLITFNDVLEHMAAPEQTLARARALLRPDGHVLASIPNLRYWPVMKALLFRGDFEYADAGVLDRTHLRFFTKKSMLRMFHSSGFAVQTCCGINGTHFTRFGLAAKLAPGLLDDMQFPQFAVVASRKTTSE